MAYKTSHRLKVVHYADSKRELEDNIRKQIESFIERNEDMDWVISEGLDEWGEDDRSFQDKNKTMQELSLKFPNLIFILEYNPLIGSRVGEIREYWFDGKVQTEYAKIEIKVNDFDLDNLESPNI